MLRELGLTALQEQVYRALLDEPTLGTADLAHLLGFPEADITAASAQLTELTLLRTSRQDPGRHYAVPLERSITVLLRRQEAELEARRKALVDRRAAATEFTGTAMRRFFQDPAGVVRITAIDDIQNTLESLTLSAVTEVCSMVPTIMPPEALEAARHGDEELLRKRVTTKLLCLDSIRTNAVASAYEHAMSAGGAQVRLAPALPIRLAIVDRTFAVLPFDHASPAEGAVVTRAPGLVAACCELFDRYWEAATPLEDSRPYDEATGLTDSEAELLRILSAGFTDEAAAKRLGISVRTVKRRMERLMRRLEAGSRFEAGVRAAQRGWL